LFDDICCLGRCLCFKVFFLGTVGVVCIYEKYF
jgi:hypothetical protein